MELVCFDPRKIYAARVVYDEDSDSVKVRFSADESLGIADTDYELCRNEAIDEKIISVMGDEMEPGYDLRSVFAYLVTSVMMADLSDAREKDRFFTFRMPNEYLDIAEQRALEMINGPAVTEEMPAESEDVQEEDYDG